MRSRCNGSRVSIGSARSSPDPRSQLNRRGPGRRSHGAFRLALHLPDRDASEATERDPRKAKFESHPIPREQSTCRGPSCARNRAHPRVDHDRRVTCEEVRACDARADSPIDRHPAGGRSTMTTSHARSSPPRNTRQPAGCAFHSRSSTPADAGRSSRYASQPSMTALRIGGGASNRVQQPSIGESPAAS